MWPRWSLMPIWTGEDAILRIGKTMKANLEKTQSGLDCILRTWVFGLDGRGVNRRSNSVGFPLLLEGDPCSPDF